MADNIVRKKVGLADTTRQKVSHIVTEERRYTNVEDHLPCPLSIYKRCRLCSTKVNDKRLKIMGQKCEVPLCIVPCFYAFHQRQQH
ncbi:unnamed protein product [Parnassius mnemosyne]|uniref:PiggyBac transposable element-derived protein 4 C-terminal zinc-ribbon domain-containing protein n=1 Tax=Parnassius mnemosyne TaxID=213953 RepID=A0AAV1KY69_9NEOP